MDVGICCVGLGRTCQPAYVSAAAQTAEQAGFTTFWIGEHVVLFADYPRSAYPYAGLFGGESTPLPDPSVDFADPVIALTWAGASTQTIALGTSIVILPQRHPVVLAKEIATLDHLSGGRVRLGVGVGWAREESEAVGAVWEDRGRRMDEYVAAMRALWEETSSTFHGDYVNFSNAFSFPKPVRERKLPIIFGGETPAALRHVARHGDGWLSFSMRPDEAADKIGKLRRLTAEFGRNTDEVRVIATIFPDAPFDDVKRFHDAGVQEIDICALGRLPFDADGMKAAIADLSQRYVEPAAAL